MSEPLIFRLVHLEVAIFLRVMRPASSNASLWGVDVLLAYHIGQGGEIANFLLRG
jgi:hypothetical protein